MVIKMVTKNIIFRRISAYIADFLLVSVIISIFSEIYILNPSYEEYINLSNEYLEYVESVSIEGVTLEYEKMNKYTYELSYLGINMTIITLVVNIMYFVFFQYFNGGKTVGKAIFNLRVKSKNGTKLKICQLLLRYSIIMGLLTSLISIIVIYNLSMNSCINILSILQTVDDTLIISCILMIFFRKDNRGLHDLISNTSVIDDKTMLINK